MLQVGLIWALMTSKHGQVCTVLDQDWLIAESIDHDDHLVSDLNDSLLILHVRRMFVDHHHHKEVDEQPDQGIQAV